MSIDSLPIIKLELQGMRHAVMHAFTRHQIEMDAHVQAAMDAYCSPENIKRVVDTAVAREIESAIQSEVEKFYKYGAGRKAVAAAVAEALSQQRR